MKPGKILRRIAMLLSFLILITSTVGTTYGFIVTSTDSIVNVFVPEEIKVDGLTLSKTVEHPLGEGYKIPDNIKFDFKIELGPYYANSKLTTTLGKLTADSSGALLVSVKPGVTLGIEGLKEGTVVKVTEQSTNLTGFSVKGEPTKTVTVGTDGVANITFVNTYTPDAVKPENVAVGGIKVLEGREWKQGDSFTFKLEQKSGELWNELGTKTVIYNVEDKNFNKFDFSDVFKAISFNAVGTYTFRISEIVGTFENLDYDKTVNHFTVLVTDVDMDGKLEINTVAGTENAMVTESNGNYSVFVTFNNTFVPPILPDAEPINVQIGVDKTVKNIGELEYGLGGFEFVLENIATTEKTTAISNNEGKAEFALTFTASDIGKTYTYRLSETNQSLSGMTYDNDVHEITVSVAMSKENKLLATLTIDGHTVKTLNVLFENIYNAEKTDSPTTRDESNLNFWIIMMIFSGATLVSLVVYEKKCRRI